MGLRPELPKPVVEILEKVRERAITLTKQYKSLSNYGRPVFEDLIEIATIYYVNQRLGLGLNHLAAYLNLDKTSLYNLIKKIEEKGSVSLTNRESKKVEVVSVTPQELITLVEERVLGASSRQRIVDPLQSSTILEFWQNNIERLANRERRQFYNESEKRETINVVKLLMEKALELGLPSNPDFWDKELLLSLLDNSFGDIRRKREAIKLLRRIPKFRNWLEGYVGAEKKYITPKMSVLFYRDYLRIKELYQEKKVGEPLFLIVWLHITTGAREGWGSESVSENDDLDNVSTSLIGLKWENLNRVGETWVLKIYEHKTLKIWSCDLSWLDPDPIHALLKYRRDKGSIVKSITGLKTVKEFMNWYRSELRKLSGLLELGFKLTPHDLRRSHISVLAELGVPLEISVSGNLDFGVGWEDLATAVIFYLRFSKSVKENIMSKIRESQKELERK